MANTWSLPATPTDMRLVSREGGAADYVVGSGRYRFGVEGYRP